jgi:hypothetical protein
MFHKRKKEVNPMSLKRWLSFSLSVILGLALLMVAGNSLAKPDEGMWTFDNPPVKILKEKYGFVPTKEWLDHIRLSSVRFMDGGSGSFVSPHGLVMTNHHVAMGQLQKISTPEKNYVETGFLARTREEEIKCPDLEINVLVSMENVTDRVRAVVKEGMSDAEALKARQAVIAEIEKESLQKTGLRSNVISLYHGGEYWLYRYKKYTDIRLVMAPERQAAYFGGDSDNFTYPRYDLDVAFFRVYENGKPLETPHYLRWNSKGAGDGELVFVSGNPGSTDRLYTYAELEMLRDYRYPLMLNYINKFIAALREYAAKGKEQQRRALGIIFGLENAKKAYTGEYQALRNKELMAKRKEAEEKFRQLIASRPEWQQAYGDAWEVVARVVQKNIEFSRHAFYQNLRGYRLPRLALTIVQYVTEVKKPDGERLPGYHDAQLNELKFMLFSPAPVYKDLEEAVLRFGLQLSLEALGPEDEFVQAALQGKTPAEVAREVIAGTKLNDPTFRKKLIEGGEEAVQKCQDPLIQLARRVDPLIRRNIKKSQDEIESVLVKAREKIAQARFAVYGKEAYPDATFTLRLAFGVVKGYPYNGTRAPYKTTLYGLFDRAVSFDNKGEFALPQRFWERKDKLDLSTPVNFVSTCDIIGGNSGSPVINRQGEVVGLIFDGNIESLSGRFMYDDTRARAVAVHTAYIIEGLRKLYDADFLADEIEGKK